MKRSWRVIGCGVAFLLAAPGIASAQTPSGVAGSAASESKPSRKRDPAKMGIADITACMRANVEDRKDHEALKRFLRRRNGLSTK